MAQLQLEKFFDLYSTNLTMLREALAPQLQIEPVVDGIMFCPICLRIFSREDLKHGDLTLEHIPPEKLGGKVRTVTCRKCNNYAGTELDSHLVQKSRLDTFSSGNSDYPIKAKVTVNNVVALPIDLTFDENRGYLMVPPVRVRKKSPEQVEAFTQELQEDISTILNISFNAYSNINTRAALLRIAYLWAFSIFGYGFIINPNLDLIRQQIQNPHENILGSNWGIWEQDFPDNLLGINLIKSPREARAFFLVFECSFEGKSSRYGIVLPGFDEPGQKVYEWLSENQGIPVHYQFNHRFDAADTFDFNQYPLSSWRIWKILKQQTEHSYP